MDEVTVARSQVPARASYPPTATSARDARRFVEGRLTEWGCVQAIESTRLLVSELVTNAVLHAGTVAELEVAVRGDRIRVEVHDGSAQLPERRQQSPDATTGRGLVILDALADRWGTDLCEDGKVVWFEVLIDGRDDGRDDSA